MKNKYTKIIFLLFIIVLFITFWLINNHYSSKYFYINKQDWSQIKALKSKYKNPKGLLTEADNYLEELSTYFSNYSLLNNAKNKKIKLCFVESIEDNKNIKYKDHSVRIDTKSLKSGDLYLSNLILKMLKGNNFSLELGLLEHIKIKLLKDIPNSKNKENLQYSIIKKIRNNNLDKEIINKIGTAPNSYDSYMPTFKNLSTSNQLYWRKYRIYENLSDLFVDYLLNLKGMKTFINLLEEDGTNEAYLKYYNKSLNELKKDWIEYLKDLS